MLILLSGSACQQHAATKPHADHDELTYLNPHTEDINTLALDDPSCSNTPSCTHQVDWWAMTASEAVALRAYLQKGGFVIVEWVAATTTELIFQIREPDRPDVDEESDPESESADRPSEMIQCPMCRRLVPIESARNMSGRLLCFGCLASWYDEDDDADA